MVLPLVVGLSSCGGGGGGSDPTSQVTPPPVEAGPAIVPPREAVATMPLSFVSALGLGSAGTQFEWDFGDGSRSTLPNPSHAYLKPGRYEVTLKVTQAGTAATTRRAALEVGPLQSVRTTCEGQGGGTWCTTAPFDNAPRLRAFVSGATRGSAVSTGDLLRAAPDGSLRRVATPAGELGTSRFEPLFLDQQIGLGVAGVVVRSGDGGATWAPVVLPLPAGGDFVDRLWPASATTVFASVRRYAASGTRIFTLPAEGLVSRDRGLTWQRLPSVVLGVSPAGVLWVRRGDDVGRSVDGGVTIENVEALRATATIETFLAFDGSDTVVSVPAGRLLSSDQGRTFAPLVSTVPGGPATAKSWSVRAGGLRRTWGQWFDAGSPNVLGGLPLPVSLHFSEDYGLTWRHADLPDGALPAGAYPELATDPHSAVAMVSTFTRRWLTVDGGRTWRELVFATDVGSVVTQVRREADGSLSFSTLAGRSFRSDDDGLAWTQIGGPAPFELPIGARPWLFADGRGLYVEPNGRGWYETADGGAHWLRRGEVTAPEPTRVIAPPATLAFSSATTGWWLVGGRVHRSVDAGRSWTVHPLPAALADRVVNLQFIDERDGYLVTQHCSGSDLDLRPCTVQLHATRDGGITWQRRETPFDGEQDLTMGWASERRGVVLPRGGGLWYTRDGGQTWQRPDFLPVTGGKPTFTDANLGWLASTFGLYRTADGGALWTPITLPAPAGDWRTTGLVDVVFDAAGVRGFIIAGQERFSAEGYQSRTTIAWRTTDGGVTWLPQ